MNSYKSAQIVQLEFESLDILPSPCKEEVKEVDHGSKPLQFKCTLCPLKFNDKEKFQDHVLEHFKPITCNDCNKTFIGDKQYIYHRKHVHNESNAIKDENEVRLGTSTRIEIKNDNNEDISLDTITSMTTSVACDVCGRLFPNVTTVVRHRKTHSNKGKRFFCNVCNNGFNKKTNLEFQLRIHTNERPFQCDQCPKSFTHISGLNCHRRIHTGERPYTCPFCPKSYAHSTDLRRHRRTHGLEEKRFTCDLCNKQFFESKFLRNHMRSHHRDQGNDGTNKFGSHVTDTIDVEITKFDECINEEYIDYEYIHSD